MIDAWIILKGAVLLFAVILFFDLAVLRLINHYHHAPTPAIATQIIDNPIRRFIQKPETVAEHMHLKPGMTVVEIGPGKGSYTIEVAKRVLANGKVYTVDIQEAVVESLKKKVDREGVTNVFPIVDDACDLPVESGSVDRFFAIACLPEIPEPVRALREADRVLKEDGIMSLSELFIDPDYPRRRTEIRWAEGAGFVLYEQFGSWFIYQLNFKKKKSMCLF